MPRPSRRRFAGGAAAAAVVAAGAVALAATGSAGADDPAPVTVPANRSVIILNGDGMGPAQRTFIQYALYGAVTTQPMDTLPFNGTLRTNSADKSFITDSAAGATAWSTGHKTLNNYAGVDTKGQPLKTILEDARDAGKTTALVEDHDVTNATMTAFAAHTKDRDDTNDIAEQYLRKTKPDIIFGGGQETWYPKGTHGPVKGGKPSEGPSNLVKEAQSLGYQYAYDKKTFAALTGPKALALVRDDALEYREEVKGYKTSTDPFYVPEHELVQKALDLSSANANGFFMAIDVDEIDDAGHDHDGPLMLQAGSELNEIVTVLKAYQAAHPETLIIVTADHETGGLTIESPEDGGAGVAPDDPEPYYDEKHARNVQKKGKLPVDSGPFKVKGSSQTFTLDWTTPEHSGVAVQVSASGPNAELLGGAHDNTWVYTVMHQTLFGTP
jgi:alkaline phosphatase